MRILEGQDTYTEVVQNGILKAEKLLWIATANLKDLHIRKGSRYVSILGSLAELSRNGVAIRIAHSAEPSGQFKKSFDKHRELIRGDVEFLTCPRLHFKMVVVDGKSAYTGSANFTGAGLGVKSTGRRNFEIGVLFNEPNQVKELMGMFDELWMGKHCPGCGRRRFCPDPI